MNNKVLSLNDWEYLLTYMPKGWKEKGKSLGALKRNRNFDSFESLLRTLLIHFVDGCSLRETAVRARTGSIANITDVALLKRLNKSGEWLNWMAVELMKRWINRIPDVFYGTKRRIRVVDGSIICEPGSTGSDWRIHYSIELKTLRCDEVIITDYKIGETLKRYKVEKNDIFIGDRGYAHRRGIGYVKESGGDVIVRINLTNLPLYNKTRQKINILKRLRQVEETFAKDWVVYAKGENGQLIKGRLCAIKKNDIAAIKSIGKTKRANSRKGRKVRPETLEAAKYIFVFTTLTRKSMIKEKVLEIYRGRWQVELAFKRLKSIIKLGHLPKQDAIGAKSWLQGKIFVAFLVESMIVAGERFFPWGYSLEKALPMERNLVHA